MDVIQGLATGYLIGSDHYVRETRGLHELELLCTRRVSDVMLARNILQRAMSLEGCG